MDLNSIVYTSYVTALLVICFAAGRAWRAYFALEPLQRTAAVLASNWAMSTLYVVATGIHDPWWWFVLVDATAARIVLYQPAGKAQALIGGFYMMQIAMHAVYFLSNHGFGENNYWRVLIALAIVQLIILGGWSVGGIYRRSRRRRDPGMVTSARQKSVGK